MRLQELITSLNLFLDVQAFSDSCPNGLQIEGKTEVKKAATAVSASLKTIEAAVEAGVDALIVHHGLFWGTDMDNYRIQYAQKKKIALLLKHDISLIAYHLPLDAHATVGNNWKAAIDLGWQSLAPFGIYRGKPIGVKGTFAPTDAETLHKQLEVYYGHSATAVLGGKKRISSAGLISGGAQSEIVQAAKADLDCFITGNFDEPAFSLAQELGIHFFALGHSATERIGPRALAKHIQESLGLPTSFLDIPNPF